MTDDIFADLDAESNAPPVEVARYWPEFDPFRGDLNRWVRMGCPQPSEVER